MTSILANFRLIPRLLAFLLVGVSRAQTGLVGSNCGQNVGSGEHLRGPPLQASRPSWTTRDELLLSTAPRVCPYCACMTEPARPMYFTVDEAAVECRRHPDTIRKALKSGEMQGHQRVPRGKWLVKPEWLDAWVDGPRRPTLAALRAEKRSLGR